MSQDTATTGASEASQFSDPKLIERLHELRRTDNWTNWIYILRAWLYLGIVVGGAAWFFVAHGYFRFPAFAQTRHAAHQRR